MKEVLEQHVRGHRGTFNSLSAAVVGEVQVALLRELPRGVLAIVGRVAAIQEGPALVPCMWGTAGVSGVVIILLPDCALHLVGSIQGADAQHTLVDGDLANCRAHAQEVASAIEGPQEEVVPERRRQHQTAAAAGDGPVGGAVAVHERVHERRAVELGIVGGLLHKALQVAHVRGALARVLAIHVDVLRLREVVRAQRSLDRLDVVDNLRVLDDVCGRLVAPHGGVRVGCSSQRSGTRGSNKAQDTGHDGLASRLLQIASQLIIQLPVRATRA
mmetsp:Transcript_99957/g.137557  ORF Transcript_99957/g.137557 Transcript_99957/m.137557 type:complete len:273 (-) Transcript_99957:13-831(-)